MEERDPASVNESVRRWLDGPRSLGTPPPPPPGKRGALTIVDILRARDPDEHVRLVRLWARTTWEAWEACHELARQWVQEALRGR